MHCFKYLQYDQYSPPPSGYITFWGQPRRYILKGVISFMRLSAWYSWYCLRYLPNISDDLFFKLNFFVRNIFGVIFNIIPIFKKPKFFHTILPRALPIFHYFPMFKSTRLLNCFHRNLRVDMQKVKNARFTMWSLFQYYLRLKTFSKTLFFHFSLFMLLLFQLLLLLLLLLLFSLMLLLLIIFFNYYLTSILVVFTSILVASEFQLFL